MTREEPWQARAACAGWLEGSDGGPDPWFSDEADLTELALLTCRAQCTVQAQCLALALRIRAKSGVWGGIDLDARRREAERRAYADSTAGGEA